MRASSAQPCILTSCCASGNFSPSAGTVTFTGGSISNSNTLAFYGLTIATSGAFSASGNFSAAGNLTVNSGAIFQPAAAEGISGSGTLTGLGTAQVTRTALKDKPADMAITMHSCRGNFRSTWIAEGGYDFVAEQLLAHTNLDGYFLEYDSDRAGGFEPLRFFPKGKKQLVLGLVTSKSGKLESKDDIKRRIDEATKYVALEQLCLSPQCGFASTEEGNVLAEDEQWAKLRMIVELSKEIWGQ